MKRVGLTTSTSWCLPAVLALLACAAPAAAQTGAGDRLAAKFREATEAQRAQQYDKAADAYAEVLRLRPDVAEVYVNYGLVRYEQKRYEDAVALLTKALELKPDLGGANLFLGLSHYALNQFEPSVKALEAAVRFAPRDAAARMWLGVALMAVNRVAEAAKALDAAAEFDSQNVDILYHRGRAHLSLSQESYQRMFKVAPQSARVHQVLAQSYQEAGREEDAINEYVAAIKLAPTLPGLREALGSLYWKTGNLTAAEGEFQKELENDPHSSLALYKLGSIRVENGNPQDGLPILEKAVKLNPNLPDAYYYLGKAQGQLGQPEAAVANLRRVVESSVPNGIKQSAFYQLSLVYRKLGRTEEARASLASFQKLKSEHDQQQAERLESKKKQQGEAANKPPS